MYLRSCILRLSRQMEWHTGCSLTQTVYTLLYVHYLDDLNPDFIGEPAYPDPERPQELITSVLRAILRARVKAGLPPPHLRIHDLPPGERERVPRATWMKVRRIQARGLLSGISTFYDDDEFLPDFDGYSSGDEEYDTTSDERDAEED